MKARALEIAQRLDDELLGATPPQSAREAALTELLEGTADTLRALVGASGAPGRDATSRDEIFQAIQDYGAAQIAFAKTSEGFDKVSEASARLTKLVFGASPGLPAPTLIEPWADLRKAVRVALKKRDRVQRLVSAIAMAGYEGQTQACIRPGGRLNEGGYGPDDLAAIAAAFAGAATRALRRKS